METYNIAGGITSEAKEFYSRIKQRTLTILEGIINDDNEYEKRVQEIDKIILDAFKPQRFDGSQGREVQLLKQFERSCGLLTKHLNVQQPEKLSVKRFYMRLADLKEEFKIKSRASMNSKQKYV